VSTEGAARTMAKIRSITASVMFLGLALGCETK
jgi:hypothetical protein